MKGEPRNHGRVLVTGASAGIGRELATSIAASAEVLVLVARRAERLEEVRISIEAKDPRVKVLIRPCDLADESATSAMAAGILKELGGIDVLVNNAGLGDLELFDRSDWARQRQIIQVNVLAPTLLAHRFLPGMIERGRGGVINIGSGAGFNVIPGAAVYVASKHYVNGFTETLLAETAGTGVVVTQVAPGPVETEFDAAAGIVGGMAGGADDFMKVPLEQCVQETLDGFGRGEPLVLPGRKYRMVMAAGAVAPSRIRRRMTRRAGARLRAKVEHSQG